MTDFGKPYKPLIEDDPTSPVLSEKSGTGSVYGTADNVPPAYAAADKEPPSYESLRSHIRASREESESTLQFLWKLMVLVVCGTVGYALLISLLFLLPVAMIVMGAWYRGDCTAEPYIPIYLIVMGAFCLLLALISIVNRYRKQPKRYEGDDEERDRMRPIEILITCFILGWFIAGNVWIYRTYHSYQWTDSSAANFCNRQFYLFSFWITSSIYMLFAGLCCCGILASLFTYCCYKD